MPKKDTISKADLAAEYGWALAVLNSDPSLKRLFDRAVKGTWTPQKFVAELRSTSWYKHNSEAMRNAAVMKKTDRATWDAKYAQTKSAIRDMAGAMGSRPSAASLTKLTANVMTFGWNDNQIRDVLAQAIKQGSAGNFAGQAQVDIETLRETAMNNGVKLSQASQRDWVRRIAAGEGIEGFEAYIRDMAAGAFPAWAEQLKAGQDVKTLADPYIEQMAKTLELNPADVDLFDPTIRKTLQSTDEAGKPAAQPMWAFEQSLKQDQRWRYTDGARNELDSVGHGVLKDFGLVT